MPGRRPPRHGQSLLEFILQKQGIELEHGASDIAVNCSGRSVSLQFPVRRKPDDTNGKSTWDVSAYESEQERSWRVNGDVKVTIKYDQALNTLTV